MPARKAKDDGLIRIEYMPLSSRQPAKRNPKLHALEDIKQSMRRFGFTMPGAVDENTGRMFAGHGRGEALDQLKAAGEEPPKRIVERDGEWYIPVLRGIAFASEEEAEAYLIADNKTNELGGYDEGVMAQMLADLEKTLGDKAHVGLGIDQGEVMRLLSLVDGPPPETFESFGSLVGKESETFKITLDIDKKHRPLFEGVKRSRLIDILVEALDAH